MELEGSLSHLQPSWARSIQPMSPHPNYWRFILILSSNLRLSGLPSSVFPSGFPQYPVCISALSLKFHRPCSFHSSWFYHPNNIWWGVQIITLLFMQSFLFPCYLVPLRTKYLPQHLILQHPRPMFLPQCDRPGFTPRQNNRKSCNSLILASLFLE
jgi:hypothetical protein